MNSFLPFHPRRPQPNPVQAQKLLDEIQLPDIRPKPTPQTSQLFSSLHSHLGSTLTRDPSATNPTQLLHTHTITLTAQAQLFRAIITFAVPSPTTTVSALQLKRLSPWARPELQPFLEREVATQDVNLLCWACGRYFDTALERAQVWSQLAAEAVACGSFVLGGRSSVTSPSKLEGDGAGSIRRVDVMPYLGKRRLQLQFGAPYVAAGKQQRCVVVFGWDIGLDRCGDPRPEYRMSVRFPDQGESNFLVPILVELAGNCADFWIFRQCINTD